MEQYELELIADELEKVLEEKSENLDRVRKLIYQKFICSIRDQNDSDLDDFLDEFGG